MTGSPPAGPPSAEAFAPLSDADWPEQVADLRAGFAGALNVYRTMAHHPALLRAWSALRAHVVTRSALGPDRLEVVILRTGARLGCAYEWQQHVVRARAAGLSDARIAALKGPPRDMDAPDRRLAEAVDALFDRKALDPDALAELTGALGRDGVLDLIATVGFYTTLGYMLNSFGTPLDDDIAALLEATPPPG